MPAPLEAPDRLEARLRARALVLLVGLLCSGCLAAPRTAELTLGFTQESVTLNAVLKDVRTFAPDELNQVLTFSQLSSPSPEWFTAYPWLPHPSSYEWKPQGSTLDLTIRATMPRHAFDECARDACGKESDRACRGFPVQLCQGEYSVDPGWLTSGDLRVLPGSHATWSQSAPATTFNFELTQRTAKVVKEGPSLLPGALFVQAHPAAAARLGKVAEAFQKSFWSKDGKGAEALVRENAPCDAREPICPLMTEVFRREQSGLLHSYLAEHESWGLSPAPPSGSTLVTNPYAELVPRRPLPESATRRLRVYYEASLRE